MYINAKVNYNETVIWQIPKRKPTLLLDASIQGMSKERGLGRQWSKRAYREGLQDALYFAIELSYNLTYPVELEQSWWSTYDFLQFLIEEMKAKRSNIICQSYIKNKWVTF